MAEPISVFTPVAALRAATKAVPAVKYAVGLVGIAAAVSLARGFLPGVGVVAMLPLLGGFILVMAVLVILAAAVASPARTPVAKLFLWATCLFTIAFMLFTVTAVAVGWPRAWAQVILPGEAPPSLPTIYSKPNGKIQKVGQEWIETDVNTNDVFHFKEIGRGDGTTTVFDENRSMYMKWPTDGGAVYWSKTNPVAWTHLYYVTPVVN